MSKRQITDMRRAINQADSYVYSAKRHIGGYGYEQNIAAMQEAIANALVYLHEANQLAEAAKLEAGASPERPSFSRAGTKAPGPAPKPSAVKL